MTHPGYLALGFILPSFDFSLLHMWRTFDLAQFPNVRPVCWPTMQPAGGWQVCNSERRTCKDIYRVTHQVMLPSKQKLHFSIKSLY